MYKPAFAILLAASAADADPYFEVGLSAGGHAFADDVELGVADSPSEPGPADSGLVGARAAFVYNKRFAIEGEVNVIPTKDNVLGDAATVIGLLAHGRFDILTGRIKPFVVAGLGTHILRTSSPQMDNDADQAYYWGVGARYAITRTLDVRLDWRHIIVPGRTLNGATSDFELTAGVSFKLGLPPPRVARPITIVAMPKPADRDGDGIADDRDQCADTPETKNGWQDEDGCADQLIEELAGIGFEHNSATIDINSAPILERAYQILATNEKLTIEIAGHTSAEGSNDDNLELSLRRAEAVRGYLLKRGIAPTRIQAVGHGAEEPIADNKTEEGRRKNRRIEFRIVTSVE